MKKVNGNKKEHKKWTIKFREYLYKTNEYEMRKFDDKMKENKKENANCQKRALRKLRLPFEQMQPDAQLPQYPSHQCIEQSYIINHPIQPQNNLNVLIPSKVKSSQIQFDAIKWYEWVQERPLERQEFWQYIKERYLCPLDVLDRLQVYFQFLRFGVENIKSYITLFCQNIKYSVFFQSVIETNRYCGFNKNDNQNKLARKHINSKYWCKYCKVYCCIRHKALVQSKNVNEIHQDRYTKIKVTQSYFQLKSQLTKMFGFPRKKPDKPSCSLVCYKQMNRRNFYQRYQNFKLPEEQKCQFYEQAKQIYGYQPCLISKAINQACSDVVIYLIASTSLRSILFFGQSSQKVYLNQINRQVEGVKSSLQKGCRCYKGNCQINSCYCFTNNMDCDPLRCHNCFCNITDYQRLCKNQQIVSENYPHLKIGKSIKKSSLGLFTMQNVQKNTTLFCVKGQIIAPHEQKLKFLLFQAQQQFKLDSNICSFHYCGKQKFIRRSKQGYANVRLETKLIYDQQYTIGIATTNISAFEELMILIE